ncbi:MAG TPA: efflux RND transporter permease subunit [Gemmatimonadaceae bacterium]|jgi:CzcA family heavy metal efflux pump|nr:efflux RND transporter permease subunit [Gemmatimonadaceae bacterium]
MWIVLLALRRPYTFVCVAILMLVFGIVAIVRMPVDIFPAINVPVVSMLWSYGGLSPKEMEQRIVAPAERVYSSYVNDIEHIESQSLNGLSIIKVFFQPDADVQAGMAQLTAASQGITRIMPTGISPPFMVRFNATDVPILQLGVASPARTEAELSDLGTNFIRVPLGTVHGAGVLPAFGGVQRLINVDIDPQALYSKGLSPGDVSRAINAQNVILPAGTAKMGGREYYVRLNASTDSVRQLGDLPIKQVNGAMVYVNDVAQVREGGGVQTNIVRENGHRGTYLSILKNGKASTLAIVDQVKNMLPAVKATLPPDVQLKLLADQSVYVRATINGVIREGVLAACLTALMILLFLGSWRSTVIVALSIPLSVLTSIIALWATGETLNVMTLGGLALAVGILVDDATVAIENIHRNIELGSPLRKAIIDGAQQIAVPAFVSTLSICIVFLPIFALSGPAAALFRPLALAVIFAMAASYFLSRTLVPTMTDFMLPAEIAEHERAHHSVGRPSVFKRISVRFEQLFERFRAGYHAILAGAMEHRRAVLTVGAGFVVLSLMLVPAIGEDFFPQVDGGQFQLHLRAPPGTRLEETERLFARVEQTVKRTIPPNDLELVLDNIGLTTYGVALAVGSNATLSSADGDMLVQLKPDHKGSTWEYVRTLRRELPKQFPGVTFFFQPADMVNQVLNLGLPAPIDVQISGRNPKNFELARSLAKEIAKIPGAADVRVQQVMDAPEMRFEVDRTKSQQIGLSQRDVASDLLVSLSSSGQTAPNFWLNPANGVQYGVSVMTPQYKMGSMEDLQRTPIGAAAGGTAQGGLQMFGNLATSTRGVTPAVVNHYNVQPVFDVFASADRRDLGGVAREIDAIVAKAAPNFPKGTQVTMRGQVESMRTSFMGLGLGILFAILLVYLVLVVNFQSWVDPLIIIMALPGALAGIVWMLFLTHTTFTVPSLMGAIMAMGVATANSVLLITFADDQRRAGRTAGEAAVDAGFARLRPVCMTALAMIIGMLPMALGMGEGGEQNAPLGRSVIGGLLMATFFTLVIVPLIYSILRADKPAESTERAHDARGMAGTPTILRPAQ